MQIKNTYLGFSSGDDVYAPTNCANVRMIGDIFESAGGKGVVFNADELTIANGLIENSQGAGLDLSGARKVSVNAMNFQGNGQGINGGAAIIIDGSQTISIAGNHFVGNGGDIASSAQIYFGNLIGPSDNLIFSANVYQTQSLADVALRPLYVYDADSGAVLTNAHFFDSPEPQASGSVYSSNAAAILPQLQSPHAPLGEINGLILRNDSTATKVDVLPGEAADSTGSVIMQLPSGCSVDLANQGAAGLDVTPRAASTTYFYFAIGSASGANTNCIASASLAPSFVNAGANYALTTTGSTLNGNTLVYNLASVAGIAPGQLVQGSFISSGTTVSAVGTYTFAHSGNFSSSSVIQFSLGISVANVGAQMLISDVAHIPGSSCTPASVIPASDTVLSRNISTQQVTLSAAASGTPTNDCITISGGNTLTLSSSASTTQQGGSVTIYTGLYRLVGALYTDSSQNVVQFTQDGDSFYLTNSVTDIKTGVPPIICAISISTAPQSCALSVPCGRAACVSSGLKVEAFGRVVGGSGYLLLSSLDQNPQLPNAFPGPPGYSINSSTANTSFPFRLHTDPNGNIRVQASSAGNTTYEVTDGWILHR